MRLRSFLLGCGLMSLCCFGVGVNAVKANCIYSCVNPSNNATYTPAGQSSEACTTAADCHICSTFCSTHRPDGYTGDAPPTCNGGSTPQCVPTAARRTSTRSSTSSGGSSSGGSAPASTGSASTGSGSSSGSSAALLAPAAPGRIGPGRCAYQCRPDVTVDPSGATRDIGVGVGCTSDDDCSFDCLARCPVASAPGSSTGNGLGAFSGRCVTTGIRCVLPVAPSTATAGAGPSGSAASGASQSSASTELENPLHTTSLTEIFGRIVKAILGLLGALSLFWFVWGGVLWMTARGDSGQLKQGQEVIKNAAIGILLIFFSYSLTSAFLSVFEAAAPTNAPAASTTKKTST